MTFPTNESIPREEALGAQAAERALIARLRDGDAHAFETLFREYWQPLYRFALRYLRAADEAEDVVQTVFCRIWRLRREWHVSGSLSDYLYLATRNGCFDRLRADAAARQWRNQRLDQQSGAAEPPIDADILVRDAEVEAAIERALAELPPKRRRVCELRFSRGLSYAEIATELNVAPKTVETQLARGMRFLRDRLRELA